MVQFEADRAFSDLEYVKTRLNILADKQPLASAKAYREFVSIINAAMLAANETGKDNDMVFPSENYSD